MSWGGYPEEDPRLIEEYEMRRYEQQEYERQQEEYEFEQYYSYYHSPQAWLDRFYDLFIKKYGTIKCAFKEAKSIRKNFVSQTESMQLKILR